MTEVSRGRRVRSETTNSHNTPSPKKTQVHLSWRRRLCMRQIPHPLFPLLLQEKGKK